MPLGWGLWSRTEEARPPRLAPASRKALEGKGQ